MTKETDELEFLDLMSDLASAIQQKGARKVFSDFQVYYPEFFEEIRVQINRFPTKPIAALLRK
jgi:hypothetical protein